MSSQSSPRFSMAPALSPARRDQPCLWTRGVDAGVRVADGAVLLRRHSVCHYAGRPRGRVEAVAFVPFPLGLDVDPEAAPETARRLWAHVLRLTASGWRDVATVSPAAWVELAEAARPGVTVDLDGGFNPTFVRCDRGRVGTKQTPFRRVSFGLVSTACLHATARWLASGGGEVVTIERNAGAGMLRVRCGQAVVVFLVQRG